MEVEKNGHEQNGSDIKDVVATNGSDKTDVVASNGDDKKGVVATNGHVKKDVVVKVDNWARQQREKDEKHHTHKGKELYVKSEFIIPDPPKAEFDGEKHSKKGRNKNRPKPMKFDKNNMLCHSVLTLAVGEEIPTCNFPNCKFTHDFKAYLEKKTK